MATSQTKWRVSNLIAGRIHVSATLREVVQEVHNSLQAPALGPDKREARHDLIRDVMVAHRENLNLFRGI